MLGLEPRVEEGLNEQGEAPPPYMPGQAPPAHTNEASGMGGNGIALQTLVGKPPDYHAESEGEEEDLGMARPAPVHSHEREGWNSLAWRPLISPTGESGASRSSELLGGRDAASTVTTLNGREALHDGTSKEADSSADHDDADDRALLATPTATTNSSKETPLGPPAASAKETHA